MNNQPYLLPASPLLLQRLETYLLTRPMREVEDLVGWLRSAREVAEAARAQIASMNAQQQQAAPSAGSNGAQAAPPIEHAT